MSLDIYLYRKGSVRWDDGSGEEIKDYVLDLNITHNLGEMADNLGIYYHVWRPDEIGLIKAGELINPLTIAINKMDSKPKYYKQFEPINGWGTFDGFYVFLNTYLEKCKEYPNAFIEVSR